MSNSPRRPPSETSLKASSTFDSFSETTVLDWISNYGKNALYVLIGLIGLSIVIYSISGSTTSQSEKHYLQAANDFSAFLKAGAEPDNASAEKALQNLKSLMGSQGDLHAAYGGAIGQTLLNRGQDAEAKPFIEAALKRTAPNNLTFYQDFAKATLLIADDHPQLALEKAVLLQQNLLASIEKTTGDERAFGDILFAFNLLRVAMLHQQLDNAKEELAAWQQWKHYAGLSKASKPMPSINPVAFRVIIQQLATGSIALPDYIAHREKLLK